MTHENELNIRLSDLLRAKGLPCRPEKRAGRGRHDIEIKLDSLTAVIEAEKGGKSKKGAIKDAAKRIKEGTADVALALCYPDGANEENLHAQIFEWTPVGRLVPKWTRGTVDDLAAAIRQLPNETGNPDRLAERLFGALEIAVDAVDSRAKKHMARAADLPADDSGFNTAATRAFLVVATAIMFHVRLDGYIKSVKPKLDLRQNPPKKFTGQWPPMSAMACLNSRAPTVKFAEAWHTILALDYRPIFETAYKTLTAPPPSPRLTRAVSEIAKVVVEIAADAAGLRHDLLGRIFHRILDTAKYDGSYYTSTAGASLLATLALNEKTADWKNAESIGNLRVADPSCGTGTLLMAAAERMRDLANRAGGVKHLGKILIENVLYGYDTNLTATHLAATTLGLLSPGTEFSKMNIERTFLGVDESGQASLGSLEFIPGGQPSLLGWAGGQQHVDAKEKSTAKIPAFDLAIMNPPFTRDSLRYDQFSRPHELALKEREKKLFRKYLGRNGNGERTLHMSSQGNNFVVLAADRLLRAGGTMAAVLPTVTATNPSSLGVRKFIAEKLDIEKIVISHDPKRPAFSENTGISELLIVGKKRAPGARPKPARVFALSFNPPTPAEAIAAANAMVRGGGKDYITAYEIPAAKIAAGDWSAVQFLSPRLSALFEELCAGGLFPVNILEHFGAMLNGRTVRGAFAKQTKAAAHGMTALWDNKTDYITSMSASYDTFIDYKRGRAGAGKEAWKQRAKLMLPARLGLPQTRAASVILERPAVASAWYPFTLSGKLADKQRAAREKLICLYLNSGAGILALMGVRDFRILGFPRFSTDSMEKLPMPDLDKLPPQKMAALASAFDKHAKKELLPFRQMAECKTRRAIDNAVADALGIPCETMDEIRDLLAKEPSISGKRYEPLALK